MKYLLDTNIVSEVGKARPHPGVVKWLSDTDAMQTCIASVTIGEITYGIARAPTDERKVQLRTWFTTVKRNYANRILTLNEETFETWGTLYGEAENRGRPVEMLDVMIAATASQHNLIVVTRNIAHFKELPVKLFNPWLEE